MINWWGIHYDPHRFPEPHLFKPERFINHTLSAGEEALLADPYQRSHFGFGGGRRICPGMHLAERGMFLNIARMLWAFDIDFKRDAKGDRIPVDFTLLGTIDGSNTTPKPFACGTFGCVADILTCKIFECEVPITRGYFGKNGQQLDKWGLTFPRCNLIN